MEIICTENEKKLKKCTSAKKKKKHFYLILLNIIIFDVSNGIQHKYKFSYFCRTFLRFI